MTKAKAAKPQSNTKTVRIKTPTFERLQTLVSTIVQHGWSAVNAERDDQPWPGAVIDQGLALLEAKLKGKR